MLRNTNRFQKGFTLVELTIATGILALLSTTLIGGLYTVLSVRSKQQSLETTSQTARTVLTTIANAVVSAGVHPTVAGGQLHIQGTDCRTIKLVSHEIVQAIAPTPCSVPVTTGFLPMSPNSVSVSGFVPAANADGSISIQLSGTYLDSLGSHDFQYQTTVTPRITL